jgi:vancomycin permeability regulator SanA
VVKRLGRLRGILAAALAALLTASALVAPATPSAAVSAASLTQLKTRGIYYLQTGDDAQRQVVLGAMASTWSRESQLWGDFPQSWETINAHLDMNYSVPKGLPGEGHVFIVLGSALSKSGKITEKIERRVELALKALKKYPRSKVLVSGGKPRKGHTEAAVMKSWLVKHGVPASRILVEAKSTSTVGNAAKSMAMLAKSGAYTSYSLISDSSHLRRASILFLAATLQVQEASGKAWRMSQEPNVAYKDMASAGKGPLRASSVAYAASNVVSLLKLTAGYKAVLANPPTPGVLTSIAVTPPKRLTYSLGEKFDPTGLVVKAVYNKGVYTRVVTAGATLSDFAATELGTGTATVTFTDGGVTRTGAFGYSVVKAASTLWLKPSTTKVVRGKTRVTVKATLGAPAGLTPTGTVRFFLDGKRLRTRTLPDGGTSVSYRYPKITTAGDHTLTVTYAGNDQLRPAKVTLKLRVRKP